MPSSLAATSVRWWEWIPNQHMAGSTSGGEQHLGHALMTHNPGAVLARLMALQAVCETKLVGGRTCRAASEETHSGRRRHRIRDRPSRPVGEDGRPGIEPRATAWAYRRAGCAALRECRLRGGEGNPSATRRACETRYPAVSGEMHFERMLPLADPACSARRRPAAWSWAHGPAPVLPPRRSATPDTRHERYIDA